MTAEVTDQDISAAATRLAEVLARENAFLRAHDLPGAAGLLGEKARALAGIAALAPDPATRAAGPRRLPEPLARQVAALVAANQRLLDIALIAQGRVVSLIARVAQEQRASGLVGYGKGGSPTLPPPAAIAVRARA